MSDIEISSNSKMKNIRDIAKILNINDLFCYGDYIGKINFEKFNSEKKGKLILVTSTNPTPYGEGKTTITIGINDALNKLGKKSIAVIREPSLGPVFGFKGGATGGGKSQVNPMVDINIHFTGDMHAITSCNNLLCSLIDNHIYSGNELNINPDKIIFHRCIDINDRILRDINLYNRKEKFTITAASEIMSIMCLSKDINDLRNKLDNILVGYTYLDKPVFVRDLKCTDSLLLLLKDAINPNLVQSLECNPVIIHGGPFANISIGCNSIIATNLALQLGDYVITEAGFGSDLGAEKFFDIACRNSFKPDIVIINTTIKALKHYGNNDLKKGINNLKIHIDNMKKFMGNIIVVLNKYENDQIEDIDFIKDTVEKENVLFNISTSYADGGLGSIDIANTIININSENNFKYLYNLNDSIKEKINKICTEIYRAKNIVYTDKVNSKINEIEKIGFDKLPICIAKTPYSITDNKNILLLENDYDITIKDIELKSGAGFIIVYLNNIIDMPGMPKTPNALNIKIDNDKKIEGLF